MTDAHEKYEQELESARLATERGDRAAAEEALSAAIETTRADPEMHREHADVLIRLGTLKQELGQPAQAEHLLSEALAVGERHVGTDQTAVVVALNELSRFYLRQSAFARAEPLLVRLLDIKRAKGEQHPEVATVLAGLAVVRQGLGDYTSTEKLYRRALEIREKSLAPNHIAIATTLEHLGDTCAARGKLGEALALYQRALPMRERTLGVGHASVRKSRERIADLELQVAEDSAETAIEVPVRRGPVPSSTPQPPPRILIPSDHPSARMTPSAVPRVPVDPAQRLTPEYVQRLSAEPSQRAMPEPLPRVVPSPVAPRLTPAPIPAPIPAPTLAPEPTPAPAATLAPRVTPESAPIIIPDVSPREAPTPAPRERLSEIVAAQSSTALEVPSQPWMGGLLAVQEELRHMERPGVSARARSLVDSLPQLLEKRSAKIGTGVVGVMALLAAVFVARSYSSSKTDDAGVTQSGAASAPLAALGASAAAATPTLPTPTVSSSPAPTVRADLARLTPRPSSSPSSVAAKETPTPAPPSMPSKLPNVAGLVIPNSVTQNVDSFMRDANMSSRATRESTTDPMFAAGQLKSSAYGAEASVATNPTLIGNMPQPGYPDGLRKQKVEGEVVVQFLVDEAGRVDASTMKVVRSPNEQFSLAVQRVLPQFRFAPARTATPQSKPRSEWVQFAFQFNAAK